MKKKLKEIVTSKDQDIKRLEKTTNDKDQDIKRLEKTTKELKIRCIETVKTMSETKSSNHSLEQEMYHLRAELQKTRDMIEKEKIQNEQEEDTENAQDFTRNVTNPSHSTISDIIILRDSVGKYLILRKLIPRKQGSIQNVGSLKEGTKCIQSWKKNDRTTHIL